MVTAMTEENVNSKPQNVKSKWKHKVKPTNVNWELTFLVVCFSPTFTSWLTNRLAELGLPQPDLTSLYLAADWLRNGLIMYVCVCARFTRLYSLAKDMHVGQ